MEQNIESWAIYVLTLTQNIYTNREMSEDVYYL